MSGCRVFIGRLSPHARERDVEKFFKGYGRIREVNLKNGFGFVEFDDHRDADDAVYELNGKELCSERVTIEHARSRRGRGGGPGMGGGGGGGGRFSPRFSSYRQGSGDRRGGGGGGGGGSSRYGPPVRTEHRIIVENLSSRISWQDLKDLMRKVGEVTFVDAHRTNKNEGVVEFASHSDMKNALDKLDGTDLNGRKLKLSEDRKSRSRSRSRDRSRSPRSRSPRSASRTPRRSLPRGGGGGRAAHRSTSRSRSKSRTPPARSHSRTPPPVPALLPPRSRSPAPRSRSPAHVPAPCPRSRSPAPRSASPAHAPPLPPVPVLLPRPGSRPGLGPPRGEPH
ncbi:serine/arginine-rich splicing factor 5 [Salvelinus sp. IW2-2015]|uniref:serine/arginine-rich splicing factor 5 n=1 Tax=Salvelinus sp. IW2-2015 TaxID=2691554 RepID=UPI000CEAB133|nr:serine/arginine-rich splicing factor 5-like [Salvelinus alpinus]